MASPLHGVEWSRPRLWYRVYHSPVAHLLVATALGLSVVWLHWVTHKSWWRESYDKDLEGLLQSAVMQYDIRFDGAAGDYALFLGNEPVVADASLSRPGPLGIGKLASFAGAVAETNIQLRVCGDRCRTERDALLRRCVRQGGGKSWLAVPGACKDANFAVVEVPTATCESAEHWAIDKAGREFGRTLAAGQMLEFTILGDAAAGSSADGRVRQAAEVATATAERLRVRTPREVAMTASARTVIEDACKPLIVTQAQLDTILGREKPATLPKASGVGAEDAPSGFRSRAVSVAYKEQYECFWLFGCWRWLEIVFWVWFGVATKMIYGLGRIAIGAQRGLVFEPREMVWAIGRCVFAPLLAFVFFWLATQTDLIKVTLDLSAPTLVVFAIAFLVGMFPDDIYNLVANALHRVLQGDAGTKALSSSLKKRVVEVPELTASAGGPKLSDLRDRLTAVVEAGIRPIEFPTSK